MRLVRRLNYHRLDAPSFEQFYFVTSKKPLDVNAILALAPSGHFPDELDVSKFREQHWEGTFWDYLEVVSENPAVARYYLEGWKHWRN